MNIETDVIGYFRNFEIGSGGATTQKANTLAASDNLRFGLGYPVVIDTRNC